MLGYSRQSITEADITAVVEVLRSDWLTQGPAISKFEDLICQITSAKYAVAVSNATAGLHLAMQAIGVSSETEVCVPTNTFVSTANTAKMLGAEVRFIDTDPGNGNLDLDDLENNLINSADVVVPVHFAGLPVDMERLSTIADERGIKVIEDASHALGAKYEDGSMVGNCKYSLCTVFSFHPVKIITTGEGGIVTTNDEELYRKLIRLRSHGINKLDDQFINEDLAFDEGKVNPWYYEMLEMGYNYRLTDIQAALGVSQLMRLTENTERRLKIAMLYDQHFKNEKYIKPLQSKHRIQNSHHLYPIRVPFKQLGFSRRTLMQNLRIEGIGTQVHYIPVHFQPFYQKISHFTETRDMSGAREYYETTLSIPCFPDLSLEDQKHVIRVLKNLVKEQ